MALSKKELRSLKHQIHAVENMISLLNFIRKNTKSAGNGVGYMSGLTAYVKGYYARKPEPVIRILENEHVVVRLGYEREVTDSHIRELCFEKSSVSYYKGPVGWKIDMQKLDFLREKKEEEKKRYLRSFESSEKEKYPCETTRGVH